MLGKYSNTVDKMHSTKRIQRSNFGSKPVIRRKAVKVVPQTSTEEQPSSSSWAGIVNSPPVASEPVVQKVKPVVEEVKPAVEEVKPAVEVHKKKKMKKRMEIQIDFSKHQDNTFSEPRKVFRKKVGENVDVSNQMSFPSLSSSTPSSISSSSPWSAGREKIIDIAQKQCQPKKIEKEPEVIQEKDEERKFFRINTTKGLINKDLRRIKTLPKINKIRPPTTLVPSDDEDDEREFSDYEPVPDYQDELPSESESEEEEDYSY